MYVVVLLKVVSVLRWIVGIAILCAAWLLKEDEEGKIANWLEEKRRAIAARRDQTLSKTTIYLQSLASIISGLFNRIFGKRLLSVQAVFISILLSALSITSLALVWSIVYPQRSAFDDAGSVLEASREARMATIVFSVAESVLLVFTFACIRYASSKVLATIQRIFFAVVFAVAIYVLVRYIHGTSGAIDYSLMVLGPLVSIGLDMLFVIVIRWAFLKIDHANNVGAIALLSLTNAMILAVIAGLTLAGPLSVRYLAPDAFDTHPLFVEVGETAAVVGASCALDAFFSLLILVACVGISVNSLVWPFVERNIYSFNRHKVLTNKKLMWSAGIALCGEPHIWNLVVKAVRAGWF